MLGVRIEERDVDAACAWSQGSLARSLVGPAELDVFRLRGHATALGAFQRTCELGPSLPDRVLCRGTGGPAVNLSEGLVWVQLALTSHDALAACEPWQLLNRYVRPLLRAGTRLGAQSHYFGRDWVASLRRPSMWVGFAYEARTRRALFEAIVPVSAPWWRGERASFGGKAPWTLDEATGKNLQIAHVCEVVAEAYGEAYGPRAETASRPITPFAPLALAGRGAPAREVREPVWQARRDEAIGPIFAGRDAQGRMRVGGELMVAGDVLARFEAALAALEGPPPIRVLERLVDEHFGAPNTGLFGVRDLASIRAVVSEAFACAPQPSPLGQ